MNVYRIVRSDRTSLDGKGAAEYPGRWNLEDVPCVYTSSTPSLAQLEVIANVDDWKIFITVTHVVLRIAVPDNRIFMVDEKDLPPHWADAVYDLETQQQGADLLSNPDILAFSVPSTVSKTERNTVLNPRATDFHKHVKVVGELPFEFDSRLMRGGGGIAHQKSVSNS